MDTTGTGDETTFELANPFSHHPKSPFSIYEPRAQQQQQQMQQQAQQRQLHAQQQRKEKHNQMTKTLREQVKKKMREKYPFNPRIQSHEQLLTICGSLVATVYMVKGSEGTRGVGDGGSRPMRQYLSKLFGWLAHSAWESGPPLLRQRATWK
jgi:hypothetical protein